MELYSMTHEKIMDLLPERAADSHKGNYGRILLICGSRGYTGAPALAAMGAMRTGAGLVYLAVPDIIYEIEAMKLTEPIVLPLPDEYGCIGETAAMEVSKLLCNKDAVLIGPGLGQGKGVFSVVRTVLEEFEGPVVLDADGINVLTEHMDILRERTCPTILTPHPGEFARITLELTGDRVTDACRFAESYHTILLLKGHRTVITDGRTTFINKTGNPGMAVGGTGDVLAGIIVSLLGQGLQPLEAAACGAWLHGAAGDICAREIGEYGMLPSDMLQVLPRLLK